ncbi:hypothetical protein HNO88_002778 [Novosphingobium chloroacetimidivorans]|uniref:Uncharacterized protein n=1 Tax=Novosphingobium chloroacetimidivorans TaxID=1428314 RepID=A0A7W7KBX9_9SPHN|nr:hypothetical protein [Novosphingobium chloroacetimidivorans]MBB4859449.1 hypothetical protein [Novosphingobium chloroacetimidivorans]
MSNFPHLYDDDATLSLGAKLWFLDVVDGRVALLPEQHDDFHFLLQERGYGRFYDSATEAYILDFQRVQGRFAAMLLEIGDDQ